MDNTELHYVAYDPDAIWEDMMLAYLEEGGDVLYPGDEKEMLLRSVLANFVQIFAGVDNALRMQTLRYAVGDYLDVLGENRGCARIAAAAAKATVTITAASGASATTLPEGKTMTADGVLFYKLESAVSIGGAVAETTATIVCTTPGTAGNALAAGTEMSFSSASVAVDGIVVATAASGGVDEESDDDYRERIREHILVATTAGPSEQYESIVKAIPGVTDAVALNVGDGMVQIVFMDETQHTGTDYARMRAAIEAAINADTVRPLTDVIDDIVYAVPKQYTLKVVATYDGANVEAAIEDAIAEYVEWQNEKIGRAFNPEKLIGMIYQAGATRAYFRSDSTFNGGSTIQYTEIAENAICTGTAALVAAN